MTALGPRYDEALVYAADVHREQLRKGADLTDLKWQELVNLENLIVDDAEPILMEIKAFMDAVRSGTQPEIDARAGFVNVRTAERIVEETRKDWATWKPDIHVPPGVGMPGGKPATAR